MGKEVIDKIIAGYREEKIKKDIITVRQEGPTCGLYASAMAIEAFDNKDMTPENRKEQVSLIAKNIEKFAKNKKYTLAGEFFRADDLCTMLNSFFSSSNQANDSNLSQLSTSVIEFDSTEELKYIVEKASERGVLSLFPFLIKDGKVAVLNEKNRTYYHAHWGLLRGFTADNILQNIKIYEGHEVIDKINITIEEIFDSNQSIECITIWPFKLNEEDLKIKKQSLIGYECDTGYPIEKVELRNKLILIGKK